MTPSRAILQRQLRTKRDDGGRPGTIEQRNNAADPDCEDPARPPGHKIGGQRFQEGGGIRSGCPVIGETVTGQIDRHHPVPVGLQRAGQIGPAIEIRAQIMDEQNGIARARPVQAAHDRKPGAGKLDWLGRYGDWLVWIRNACTSAPSQRPARFSFPAV